MTTTNPIPTQPETLEPCPFCGVFPVMQSHTQEDEMDEGRYVFFVECGNRQCPMGLVSTGGPFRESAKAAECWNTRAAVTAPRGDAEDRIRLALEGMIAAFDRDDYSEASIVATTRECALSIAKQAVGWDAATSSPTPAEPRICVKCGHSNFNRVQGECDEPDSENIFCGCKCELAPAERTREVFDAGFAAAPADNNAESSSVVELRSACCSAPTRTTTTDYNVCTACTEPCETTATTTKGDR